MNQVKFDDQTVFLERPLALADVWVEMIVPSLAALLTDAAGQALGHMCPVLCALSCHNVSQNRILVLGPGTFGEVGAIGQLEPSRVTLDLRLAVEKLADSVPGVLAEALDVAEQLGVLHKSFAVRSELMF